MGAILFLVEGVTDKTTLEAPICHYFSSLSDERRIFFHAANGDLTAKGSAKSVSTRDAIKKEVSSFLSMMKLKAKDLDAILELTDLDACFAKEESYVQSEEVSRQTYLPEKKMVYVEEAAGLYQSRKRKADNLLFLVEGRTLWLERVKIPHYLCYFSINLEHALYDAPNCKMHEKKSLAFAFEEKYAENVEDFLSLLEKLQKGRGNYLDSWNLKLLKETPYQRASNLLSGIHCLLGEEKIPLF